MNKLEPLQSFSFEGNWKLWLKHFNFYSTVTEKDGKNAKIKNSVFWTYVGQKDKERYVTFSFAAWEYSKNRTCVRNAF